MTGELLSANGALELVPGGLHMTRMMGIDEGNDEYIAICQQGSDCP